MQPKEKIDPAGDRGGMLCVREDLAKELLPEPWRKRRMGSRFQQEGQHMYSMEMWYHADPLRKDSGASGAGEASLNWDESGVEIWEMSRKSRLRPTHGGPDVRVNLKLQAVVWRQQIEKILVSRVLGHGVERRWEGRRPGAWRTVSTLGDCDGHTRDDGMGLAHKPAGGRGEDMRYIKGGRMDRILPFWDRL